MRSRAQNRSSDLRPALRAVVVDLAVLTAVVGDEPATIAEVLQASRETAMLSRGQVKVAMSTGAAQALGDIAHELKGAALSIGATRLGELCAAIEVAAAAASHEPIKALLRPLDIELEAVMEFRPRGWRRPPPDPSRPPPGWHRPARRGGIDKRPTNLQALRDSQAA